jgi:hypothetical protein
MLSDGVVLLLQYFFLGEPESLGRWNDWWDEDNPASHSLKCTCEHCIQNHPERDLLYGSGDNFDWGEEE